MREFTPLSVILGVIIGVIMGAANAYIGLRYGLTISASIPAAVISMGILRGILRRGTILENNIVQTVGSAGESLAAGLVFTVPALFILAAQYPDAGLAPTGYGGYIRIVLFGILGGLLGVLMMIPMRRYLIVQQHGKLRFPEGTACAEVLKSGEKGATGAALVFVGLFLGALHSFLGSLMGAWRETIAIPLRTVWFDLRTNFEIKVASSLLGVGFILGLRVSAIMVGGGLLAWLVIIPLMAYFGQFINEPLAPATVPIRELDPNGIWTNYIRYVGAGGVVFGGLISLFRAFPTIMASVWHAFGQVFRGGSGQDERTDRDLPIWIVFLGTVVLIFAVWLVNRDVAGLPGAIAVAVFGFIFVAVASRIVGEVGSTSSPVSGMTIATLLGTGLIFKALGFSGAEAMAGLIGVGAVVCIALAIAGDCSQDLKTGFLVGATPQRQQVGEIIGVITSALTCAAVLLLLNRSYGFVADDPSMLAEGILPRKTLLAPQANVVALVLRGLMDTGLPWELVLVGMASAFVVECLGVSSLPFAVGLYLPLEVTTPIFVGGLLHWLVAGRKNNERATHAGVLGASGLVAGDALMGLLLAGLKSANVHTDTWLDSLAQQDGFTFLAKLLAWRDVTDQPWHGWVVSAVPFAVLILWMMSIAWLHGRRGRSGGSGGGRGTPPPVMPPIAGEGSLDPATTRRAMSPAPKPADTSGFKPIPLEPPGPGAIPPGPPKEPPSSQTDFRQPVEPPSSPHPVGDEVVDDWFKEGDDSAFEFGPESDELQPDPDFKPGDELGDLPDDWPQSDETKRDDDLP